MLHVALGVAAGMAQIDIWLEQQFEPYAEDSRWDTVGDGRNSLMRV